MSELRVDNIVSEDGSAAPIYSKGMIIGAGQTLTCSGDFSVGGNVTFDSGATVTGVVTFSQTNLSSNLNLSGVVTATSFHGDGSNLTGIDATALKDSGGNVKIQANESGAVVTGVLTSTNLTINGNSYPTAGPLSNRNLIDNGAFQVAQRSNGPISSTGYVTVDRFFLGFGGVTCQQSRETLSSGDPFNEGFRHYYRMQNTSTSTSTTAYAQFNHRIEAANVATSGWNYVSSSSFLTSSFWARSSVAGTYFVQYRATDAGSYYFNRSFTLAANTWTRVSHTIPGNSSVVVNNDNGTGLEVVFVSHYGPGYQGANGTDGSWFTLTDNDYFPSSSYSQDWANTTSATFDVTGIQLEVGEVATPFEHRSYGDELRRCKRYYERVYINDNGNTEGVFGHSQMTSTTQSNLYRRFEVEKRTNASFSLVLASGTLYQRDSSGNSVVTTQSITVTHVSSKHAWIRFTGSNFTAGGSGQIRVDNTTDNSYYQIDADL